MKLRSQSDAEMKASKIAQKLKASGRGNLITKMGIHADNVLAGHKSKIEQHMKKKPDASADPADHAEWQEKLDKQNRFYSYWSGVSSGFRKHDPFFNHVGTHGTYKESTDMTKTVQDIIAEGISSFLGEAEEGESSGSKSSIELKDLRAKIKPLGFGVKTTRQSWGTHATFHHLESGEELTGNVFTKDSHQKWKPLLDVLKGYDDVTRDGHKVYGIKK